MRNFVHLHCHSEYSLLEGALRVPKMVDAAKALGMDSVALTDNGTMFGTIEFYLKAKASGINPIIGCDMYLTPDMSVKERAKYRLILLCKNFKGYQSLIKVVTESHLNGFYYKARVDLACLAKYSEGLIAISPGNRGPVAYHVSSHQDEEATRWAESLKGIYGDDFYLGIQRLGLPFEDTIIDGTYEISRKLECPVVATNDVYYPTRDTAYLRNVLSCIQTGKRLEEEGRRFESEEQYFKTPDEMATLFQDHPDAIANTVAIAKKCKVEIETDQVRLPQFKCPDNKTSEEYLEHLVWTGVQEKYGEVTDELKARVRFEMDVITKMHYSNYFLIIFDFLDFCKRENIPVGPGRGSAAGSIVSYALNITRIDPLRYNLLFERFLNPERISMPDVDIDFCIKRRGEVIDYIVKTYGSDCVSQIITFGTMQARAVVRDVGRVLNIPLSIVDRIAKLIPAAPGKYTSIAEALEQVPDLKKMYEEAEEYRQLLDIGSALEGQARHSSTHAAGVVISRDPLDTVVPLTSNDGQIATQYEMTDIEKIGLLKMDILGLRNLTVMQDSVNLITKNHGITLDLDKLPLDDSKTYAMLCDGKGVGVFQLEGRGMRQLLKDMQPQVFEDIIALLALYRPGPLGSGMVSDFVSNKSGKTQVRYEIDVLEPILKDTYGMIVYQEQVMQIASVIGGFTLGQADMLRRAMGKKKKEDMDKMREAFLDGAKLKKFPSEKSERIFDLCYKFAEYGFNKSHSAAYAMISYQTAYLKANYPAEYMASLLSSVLGSSDKTSLYIQECAAMGLRVLPPSVNESIEDFSIVPDPDDSTKRAIRFGLGAVKNVGEGAVESIILNRKTGPYLSLMDLCSRVDLKQTNKRVLESLIKSGAMDDFGNRSQLLSVFERVLERGQVSAREQASGMMSLFGGGESSTSFSVQDLMSEDYVPFPSSDLLKMEKDVLGLYISGHPLDGFRDMMSALIHSSATLTADDDGIVVTLGGMLTQCRRIITRTKREMVTAVLEDLHGSIPLVLFQNEGFDAHVLKFEDDNIVTVKGKVRVNNDEVSLMLTDITVMDHGAYSKRLYVDIEHLEDKHLETLKIVAKRHKGPTPLMLSMGDTTVMTHKKYWVSEDPSCKAELEQAFGAGRVWLS